MWCSHPRFIPRVSWPCRACAEACFTTYSLVPFAKAARVELVQAKINTHSAIVYPGCNAGSSQSYGNRGSCCGKEVRACFSPCAGVAGSCEACGSAMVAQAATPAALPTPEALQDRASCSNWFRKHKRDFRGSYV